MNHSITSRILGATALALTAGLVLAGCSAGGSTTSSDSIDVVSRWAAGSPEAEAQQRVFDAFTKDTGIKVNLTDGLENIDDQVENAVAAGKSPELVIVNLFDKTLGWLDAGVTVPVDDYVSDWGLADKLKTQATDEWRVGGDSDGALQGFPYSGFSWPLWYNTKLLSDAGIDAVPTTTDELIAAAKALRAAGTQPLIVGGNDWSGQKLFYQIIESYTDTDTVKDVLQNGGYCATPELVEGIDLFTELRDAGVFVDNIAGYTADDMYATYYAENAAIMPAGSWAYAGAIDAGTPVAENTTLGGFPVPDGSVFDKPTAFQGFTGVGFMVTKKGAEDGSIDKVRQLIEAFYSEASVGDFVETASIVPSITGDFSQYAQNPLLAQSLGLDEKASYAILPDVWIGSASDPIIQVIALAYGSASTDEICAGLDQATAS